MNHHRRRGFRSRPQKNGFRRRNNPQDHASQVYKISQIAKKKFEPGANRKNNFKISATI